MFGKRLESLGQEYSAEGHDRFGDVLGSSFGGFLDIFEGSGTPFWCFFGSWRVSGPPLGRSGVLLSARVPPRGVQGAKSWCLGLPMGSQIGVIC